MHYYVAKSQIFQPFWNILVRFWRIKRQIEAFEYYFLSQKINLACNIGKLHGFYCPTNKLDTSNYSLQCAICLE